MGQEESFSASQRAVFVLLVISIVAATGSLAYLKLGQDPEQIALSQARKTQAQVDLKQIAKALNMFQKAKGRYPESLKELVPDYIQPLPKDPWGAEYIYNPSAAKPYVASFGKDHEAGKHPWFDYETLDVYVYYDAKTLD